MTSSYRRAWGPENLRIDYEHDYGVTVHLGHGVELLLARSEDAALEVWAVRIDGAVYREPRDLEGEPLLPGPFHDLITAAEKDAR